LSLNASNRVFATDELVSKAGTHALFSGVTHQKPACDPSPLDWHHLQLPDTWVDQLDLSRPLHLFRFFKCIFSKRARVQVAETLPGLAHIPKYALQEFHNLPNGNYSNSLTSGYIKGFDISMLNKVEPVRQRLAAALAQQKSVLDVGCAGGKTAAAIKQAGVPEVWGLDPSPYLLQHAAKTFADIHFVQGKAEETGFRDKRFDGISACFLFHEMPPKYADAALAEFNRILSPGGLLAIAEPSPIQYYENSWLRLFRDWGFSGMYFRILAHFVFEPFIESWHQRNIIAWMENHGFEVLNETDRCPIRTIIARKK
jgi:ubiquinone/menaquinone biosynthesis C-methylase UbiE